MLLGSVTYSLPYNYRSQKHSVESVGGEILHAWVENFDFRLNFSQTPALPSIDLQGIQNILWHRANKDDVYVCVCIK